MRRSLLAAFTCAALVGACSYDLTLYESDGDEPSTSTSGAASTGMGGAPPGTTVASTNASIASSTADATAGSTSDAASSTADATVGSTSVSTSASTSDSSSASSVASTSVSSSASTSVATSVASSSAQSSAMASSSSGIVDVPLGFCAGYDSMDASGGWSTLGPHDWNGQALVLGKSNGVTSRADWTSNVDLDHCALTIELVALEGSASIRLRNAFGFDARTIAIDDATKTVTAPDGAASSYASYPLVVGFAAANGTLFTIVKGVGGAWQVVGSEPLPWWSGAARYRLSKAPEQNYATFDEFNAPADVVNESDLGL